MKRSIAAVVVVCLMSTFPAQSLFAHGGGLDSHGCHRETATGGYHCHRGGSDSSSSRSSNAWKTVGGVLVVLVVIGVAVRILNRNNRNASSPFIPIAPERDGFDLRFNVDESSEPTVGVVWRVRF